jgi:hypothetical protein
MRFAFLLVLVSFSAFAAGRTRVRAHTAKDGTYVPSHTRTKADSTKANNWSTKGNVNPNTGKKGSK